MEEALWVFPVEKLVETSLGTEENGLTELHQ